MEKITRKDFVTAICEHSTIFLGCPRRDAAWIADRLEKAIETTDFELAEHRTAKQRSNFIEFCNGSMLRFDQKCEKACYHAEKMGKNFFMFEEKYIDNFDKSEHFCTCVYCIV